MLELLKRFDADRILEMEELLTLSAFGRQLDGEFEANEIEKPEWLAIQRKAVAREIASRNTDQLEKKLRAARARVSQLKTTEEKRAEAQAEIDALEAKLGLKPQTA